MDSLRYYISPLVTSCGILGFALGGPWVWLGAATFPVLLILDILLPKDFAARNVQAPVVADLALYLQLPLMVGLYAALLIGVRASTIPLDQPAIFAGSLLTIGWLSGVPTLPVAHELMHRRHPLPRRIAQGLSLFYGDPNRDIAHVTTHHLELDTHKDSDTPRRGQTIYGFIVQATRGSYMDAFHQEAQTLRRQGRSPWNLRNRTYQQVILLIGLPLVCFATGGLLAMVVCLGAMMLAKALVEGFNYFQHYGLIREVGAPIEIHHAWNHMGAIVRPLGCEITNHINHHLDGHTPFYKLKPEPDAPQMPSLFLCFLLGLVPPLWFNLIAKPKLKDWDARYASDGERKLAKEANLRANWPAVPKREALSVRA